MHACMSLCVCVHVSKREREREMTDGPLKQDMMNGCQQLSLVRGVGAEKSSSYRLGFRVVMLTLIFEKGNGLIKELLSPC